MARFNLRDKKFENLLFAYVDVQKTNLFVGIVNPYSGKLILKEKNVKQTQEKQLATLKKDLNESHNWYGIAITKHRADGRSHQCIRYIERVPPQEEEDILDRITFYLRRQQRNKDMAELDSQARQPKVFTQHASTMFFNKKIEEELSDEDTGYLIDSIVRKFFCPAFH